MNKKVVVITFIILLINPFLFGENNMTQISIWDAINVWRNADQKNENTGSYEESIFLFSGQDFLKNCSIEIKTIIAFYLKYVPYYITIEKELEIAKALGNFSSLANAQQILLQNKENCFSEIRRREDFWIDFLTINIDKNKVFVNIGRLQEDEYLLKENGDFVFVKTLKL